MRELLQWRNYAGLYEGCQLRSAEGELVHMKARLRALEAFEKLGNWGQVRWALHGAAQCCFISNKKKSVTWCCTGLPCTRSTFQNMPFNAHATTK